MSRTVLLLVAVLIALLRMYAFTTTCDSSPDGRWPYFDPRLTWIDAMWSTGTGSSNIPAEKLDKTSENFAGGPAQLSYPMKTWETSIQHGPPVIDHK